MDFNFFPAKVSAGNEFYVVSSVLVLLITFLRRSQISSRVIPPLGAKDLFQESQDSHCGTSDLFQESQIFCFCSGCVKIIVDFRFMI